MTTKRVIVAATGRHRPGSEKEAIRPKGILAQARREGDLLLVPPRGDG